jgi:succinate dehydrogenase / fumarate reductase flavoprotein subunit
VAIVRSSYEGTGLQTAFGWPGSFALNHVSETSERSRAHAAVVFGRAAALRAMETMRAGEEHPVLPRSATARVITRLDRIRWSKGRTKAETIRLTMQQTMQCHCAVFRDGPLLDDGVTQLDRVMAMKRKDLGVTDHSMVFNTDLIEALELDNMLAQANVSLNSAIGRTESRPTILGDLMPLPEP